MLPKIQGHFFCRWVYRGLRVSTGKVSHHRKKDIMILNTSLQVEIVVKMRGQHIAYRDYTGAQTNSFMDCIVMNHTVTSLRCSMNTLEPAVILSLLSYMSLGLCVLYM